MKQLLVVCVSFLVTITGLDLFFQVAEIQSPVENEFVSRIGMMYRTNTKFSRFSEGFFLGRTNSYGCLGAGAPEKRTGDEVRVLLLGDSFPLGHTVFERHHFARTLERVLATHVGRPVEVLNFSRADFALANMYQHYEEFASRWDHDLALFFADQTDLNPRRLASENNYPGVEETGDGVRFTHAFEQSPKTLRIRKLEPLLHRTVVPRMVFELLKIADRGEVPHLIFGKLVTSPTHMISPLEVDASPDPMPRLTRLVLGELAQIPRAVLVLSGPTHEEYRRIIGESGVRTIDLDPVFERLRSEGVDPYYWPITRKRGHWNHATHDAIGERLGNQARLAIGSDS